MGLMAVIDSDTFQVRQACEVVITLTSTRDLAPGDTVELQFPNTWSLISGPSHTRAFQTTDSTGEHYVSVSAEGATFELAIRPRHLPFTGHQGRHGRHVVATLTGGVVRANQEVTVRYANTYAPYVSEAEQVWVRVKGEAPTDPPTLTVRPGPHKAMRLLAPSGVEPGDRFEVLAVSLDEFENASSTAFENETLRIQGGVVLAEGIGFVGSARIPVALVEAGVVRFTLAGCVSNAVRVGKGVRGPYWGDTHIHTKLSSDGQGTDPYDYARDVSGLDFAATADHWNSLGPEGYELTESWAEHANCPGRFVTLPADERNPVAMTGHHNMYFRDIESFRRHAALPDVERSRSDAERLADFQSVDPERVMFIPHHTGICFGDLKADTRGSEVDWDAWPGPALRPVMEIYSHHGQSEMYDPQHVLAYEFNRMRNPERRANTSTPGPHYARDWWRAGQRIGVIGSSDEHSGQGGKRHGGIAAVFADELTREAVFDAIARRRCYATTGERILVDFDVDGAAMGQAATRPEGSEITIRLSVWATELLVRVEILRLRFGMDSDFQPILSSSPRPESTDAAFELTDRIAAPCIYYARAVQQPLEWPAMAWTSPVWVDLPDGR